MRVKSKGPFGPQIRSSDEPSVVCIQKLHGAPHDEIFTGLCSLVQSAAFCYHLHEVALSGRSSTTSSALAASCHSLSGCRHASGSLGPNGSDVASESAAHSSH